jgi:hypothetical protein
MSAEIIDLANRRMQKALFELWNSIPSVATDLLTFPGDSTFIQEANRLGAKFGESEWPDIDRAHNEWWKPQC